MVAKELSKSSHKPNFTALFVGFLLLAIGVVALVDRYKSTHGQPNLPVAEQVITDEQGEPEETKLNQSALDSYSVPADQPRSITIKSVGISGLIQKVGITKANAMAVPSNIHLSGWYTSSVKPGEPGLSIINGHVLGRYHDGIFHRLPQVKVGDEIAIEFGDKSIKKFEVVETATFPADQSATKLFTEDPNISAQLNLITCGGKYDKISKTYSDRVIVISRLLTT